MRQRLGREQRFQLRDRFGGVFIGGDDMGVLALGVDLHQPPQAARHTVGARRQADDPRPVFAGRQFRTGEDGDFRALRHQRFGQREADAAQATGQQDGLAVLHFKAFRFGEFRGPPDLLEPTTIPQGGDPVAGLGEDLFEDMG